MAKISEDDWERYYWCENAIGVVTVHEQHVTRVAEILSERFRGVLFIWDIAYKRQHDLCAVRQDRRKFARGIEEKIVAAGERINKNVAIKHPVKSGFLTWLFSRRVKPGWFFQPEKE